jgi:hypothetical protein
MACPSSDSAQRANIDDSAVSGSQMLDCLSRNQKRTACIGLEDGVPLVKADAIECGRFKDGGVVDEKIEPAESRFGGGNGAAY